MSSDLLRTKLYVPPLRPTIMPRPRLIHLLNQGLQLGRKLTLLSAPAGSGKTTLLTEWLSTLADDHAFSWLSLDSGDNDTGRFLAYLVTALQAIDERIGHSVVEQLKLPKLPAVDALLTTLINDVAEMASPFLLIFDDYHTIVELGVHEAVGFLLERQPRQMHLVIASRQDPPLALSRLRGHGQVTELRQADLRFSQEETKLFLNQSMGLQLTESETRALGDRAEGWIVGLQLAALALQSRRASASDKEADASQFVADFSGRHHYILDYLTDEVLARQPRSLNDFLLNTSILNRLCGPLCDTILAPTTEETSTDEAPLGSTERVPGTPGYSQSTLEYLDHANLFLVPLDDERKWYRYHHLFADLLRVRLREERPDQIYELHRRAAQWFEQHRFTPEAVHHALATQDPDWAADVMERAVKELANWSSGDISAYLRWLDALPVETVSDRPWLKLFATRANFLTGRGKIAMQMLIELEAWLEQNPSHPEGARLLETVLADRMSYAAVQGEVKQVMSYAQRILAHMPREDRTGRIRPLSILGLAAFRAGELARAKEAFEEAVDAILGAGPMVRFAAVPLTCNLAEIQVQQGHLGQARQTCQRAMQLGGSDGEPTSSVGFAHQVMAKILYEQNDLDGAEQQLREGQRLLSLGGITEGLSQIRAIRALVKCAQGDGATAAALAQEAVQTAQEGDIRRLAVQMSAYQARIWLSQGELDLAANWAREYRQVAETEYLREFEEFTLARVLLAQDRPDEAAALLRSLLPPAEAEGRTRSVMEIHVLSALAQQMLGNSRDAAEHLGHSLALAEPEGYVRIFLDEGEPMRRLLQAARQQDIYADYVMALLDIPEPESAAPHPAGEDTTRVSPTAPVDLVESLTSRELEVLRLLAEGLTNPEIGQRLFLSPNTVRTHTYNLYGKLGVHNRMNAVSRARELGLL